jgi:hypothetical protein
VTNLRADSAATYYLFAQDREDYVAVDGSDIDAKHGEPVERVTVGSQQGYRPVVGFREHARDFLSTMRWVCSEWGRWIWCTATRVAFFGQQGVRAFAAAEKHPGRGRLGRPW